MPSHDSDCFSTPFSATSLIPAVLPIKSGLGSKKVATNSDRRFRRTSLNPIVLHIKSDIGHYRKTFKFQKVPRRFFRAVLGDIGFALVFTKQEGPWDPQGFVSKPPWASFSDIWAPHDATYSHKGPGPPEKLPLFMSEAS